MNRPRTLWAGLLLLTASLAGCGADDPTPPATPAVISGLGATIARWNAAHEQDAAHCPRHTCYGAPIEGDPNNYQWAAVNVTDGGIVDGYDMNFGQGTTLEQAQAEVMKGLPADTKTMGHRLASSADGSSQCYLWNLQSATLAGPLSDPKIGDPSGEVGVVLSTVLADGTSAYSVKNINTGSVSIAPSTPDTNC